MRRFFIADRSLLLVFIGSGRCIGINAVWFDVAGKHSKHDQDKQRYRERDAYSECLGGAFSLTLVLEQKYHATAETDHDRDQGNDDKNLDKHWIEYLCLMPRV